MIRRAQFGEHPSGRDVDAIVCTNANGLTVEFLTYGGVIRALHTPDRDGRMADVVLGFDTMAEYLANPFYFGALVGRNANRIARGRLPIGGHEFALTINDTPNHLHGGKLGLHQALWEADTFDGAGASGAVLTCTSAAGDDGYPGTVSVRVTYTLADDDTFRIVYEASTDAPTPVNLTQHSYFNLASVPGGDVLGHELTINAAAFTPVDDTLIPLGAHQSVDGTPFDFRIAHAIGRDVTAAAITQDAQLRLGSGYDHNWVLDGSGASGSVAPAAVLRHAESGRALEIATSEVGLQVYAGGTFTADLVGKGGVRYPRFGGIALETQAFPDAPNQPGFPDTILEPGGAYRSETAWRFSIVP